MHKSYRKCDGAAFMGFLSLFVYIGIFSRCLMNLSYMRKPLAALCLVFGCAAAHAQLTTQQTTLPVIPLNIGLYVIQTEVASTLAQREQGLMGRKAMAENAGMLFDLERPALLECMWMKDTLLPLSVAFIDETGKIINIEEMQPMTEDQHCSAKGAHVRYALEMNIGWFKKKHIKAGAVIQGLPGVR
jgi:uncharacterized membrane protein (UPF0127 family)